MTDDADSPSNFALSISEKLIEQDSFELSAAEIAKLTPFERAVLDRTAAKNDMIGLYFFTTGRVTFRKKPESC